MSEEDAITIRLNQINDILENAIRYGGDSGGIYCDEEYKQELIKSLKHWVKWQGYEDKLLIYFENNIPKILIKDNLKLLEEIE